MTLKDYLAVSMVGAILIAQGWITGALVEKELMRRRQFNEESYRLRNGIKNYTGYEKHGLF